MLTLLLMLIFIRPFISSLLFPALDFYYSSAFLTISIFWLFSKKQSFLSPLGRPALFFFLALSLSYLTSANIIDSLKSLPKYLTYIAGFYIAAQFTEKEKNKLVIVFFFAAAVITVVGICQYFFGFQIVWDLLSNIRPAGFEFAKKYLAQKRIFSVFATPTVFAGYIILIIPLILGHFYEKGPKRIFINPLVYLAGLLGVCLFLTKSIGAFLSLFIALILFFMLTGLLDKKTFFISLATFSIILAVLIALRNYLRPQALPPFQITTLQRQMFWKDTWEMIKTNPLRGTGLGNFSIPGTKFAHNSYLQIWAEMGILAFITFLLLITAYLKRVLAKIKMIKLRGLPATGLFCGIFASFCAFLIHNIVDFTFFTPEVALYWWIILGLLKTYI